MVGPNKPNKSLQARLRRKIEAETFAVVCKQVKADGRTLSRYLADLPMRTITFHGIEAMIADALKGAKTPSSGSTEASEDGLR